MNEAPPTPPLAAGAATRRALALAAGGGLLVAAVHYGGVARTSVDVPFLDDWDAVLGFQVYWSRATALGARARLLFDPHNEHLLVLPRLAVLGVHALTGRVDFTWLNLIGNACSLALLLALWAGFGRGEPLARRALAFLPAVFIVLQPQAWTAVISPTVSLSNLGVLALAAACYAALASRARPRLSLAAGAAVAAMFCSANGGLVAPLGSWILWQRGQRGAAWLWGAMSLAALAAYLAAAPSDYAASDPLTSLRDPADLLAYFLNFVGVAPGFARSLPSLGFGLVVTLSFGVLAARGLPRRDPALFVLALFVFASIAANALVRAHQGSDAPLFQPRYRLYSALLLALTHLAWYESLSGSARRRWLQAATLAALLFWGASVYGGTAAARGQAAELEAGLAHWWRSGAVGLRHPDGRKAEFFLHAALDGDLLALPKSWQDRFGTAPSPAAYPPARTAVSIALESLALRDGWLVVVGRAQTGAGTAPQRIDVALSGPAGDLLAPALNVAVRKRATAQPGGADTTVRTGFHALIDTRSLAPGSYRLGLVLQQGERRHFAWTGETLAIAGPR